LALIYQMHVSGAITLPETVGSRRRRPLTTRLRGRARG
jgi:hypothetical protein